MPTDYNSGLIQGGVWPNLKSVTGIEHESTKQSGLSHTSGTLSMARTGVGTATTEYFICIGDQTSLDAGRSGTKDSLGFAAFGKITKGMDIVRKMQATKSTGDQFEEKIRIANIERD
jgi:peptidyl-prolyl cis-trans isomerase A (cyclophilin A)